MSELRTVYHNRSGLLTSQLVLDELGLTQGQSITEDQMWRIISLNAAALVADIDLRKAAGQKGLPDTSGLKELLKR